MGQTRAVSATTTGVPAAVVADSASTPTVQIVNTYTAAIVALAQKPGSLTITKTLQGASELRGDIQIRVQCLQVSSPGGTFDETKTVPAGWTWCRRWCSSRSPPRLTAR